MLLTIAKLVHTTELASSKELTIRLPTPVFLGVNTPIDHGSVLAITEHAAKCTVKMIRKGQIKNTQTSKAQQDAGHDFSRHIEILKNICLVRLGRVSVCRGSRTVQG